MSEVIAVKNLCKSFGELKVLNGVSLSVNTGDVIAVVGPSGSGKTTLLRCMNFLEKAESGVLSFDGQEYELNSIHRKEVAAIRKKTSFVFQNYNLFLNKTALENVAEGLVTARKMPKDKAYELSRAALDKVGLSDRYDHYPSQLSGGQQQRVGIARALVTDPEIIYLDEPTSALDPELIGEVLNVIGDLAAEGRTMIIVTHELRFAAKIANRAVFMDKGRILEEGPAQELFTNPREERVKSFIAGFGDK